MSVHPVALVGRERELQLLRAAAAAARQETRVALVVGEAGVGKTRLAHEVRSALGAEWIRPTSHGVDLAGGEIPWGGVTELVRGLVRELGAPEVRRVLGREAATLGALVPSLEAGRDTVDRAAVTGSVLTLLDGIGRPVCWLLDDAQWLDATTVDTVRYLARASSSPLLLLLTVRTSAEHRSDLPPSLAELGRAGDLVTLAPLGRPDVRRQVGLLDDTLAPEEVERICVASDGLPFFVEALVSGRGAPDDSLQSVLRSTLGALSPGAKRLLGAAAVGDGLLLPLHLRRVVGQRDFEAALAEVRAAGVLVPDPESGMLRFRHALLREEVEGRLLADERRELHAGWAAALEQALADDPQETVLVVERGRHLHALGGPEAVAAVRAAAEAADHLQDDQARCHWWSRVLELLPADADVVGRDLVLARLISALRAVGALDVVADVVDAELEGSTDWFRSLWLRIHGWNARRGMQMEFGSVVPVDEAASVVERLDAAPQDFRATQVRIGLADELVYDMPEMAEHLLTQALSETSAEDDPLVLAEGWSLLSWLDQLRGDAPAGVRTMRRGIESLAGRPEAVRDLRCFLAGRLMDAGDVDAAIAQIEENLAVLRDGGLHPIRWTQQQLILAVAYVTAGRWPEAEERLAIAAQGVIGGDLETWWHFVSAWVAAQKGEVDAARGHLAQIPMPPAGTRPGARWSMEAMLRAFGRQGVAVAEGDVRGAVAGCRDFVAVMGSGDPAEDLLRTYLPPLRLAGRHESDPDVRSLAMDALALAERWESAPTRTLSAICAEVAALVRRLDDRDDAETWAWVADRWTSLTSPWDTAFVRVFEAECLARDGDVGRAREVLQAARLAAEALGARPLVRRVDVTARQVGVLLPTPRRTGDGVLTAREREVLALVAEGRTNGQIAAELVMSPKTVSVHVSHVIAKLGVTNRTEAAALSVREGMLDRE